MNKDIMGNTPVVGDAIIRTKYDRDSSLYMCKVIGETKNGNPKVIGKNKWFEHGAFATQSEFIIVPGVNPNTI